jgi:hypothetical protein
MSNLHPEQPGTLAGAILSAMPGWDLVDGPEPFGWAPERHSRAGLVRGGDAIRIVIRHSWSPDGHERELYLYHGILPHLSIRTAMLHTTFEFGDAPGWMVLEDLGSRHPRRECVEDRQALLHTLGSLHGQAILLVEQQLIPGHPLTRFDACRGEYGEWMDLLTRAAACPCSGVRKWMPALLAQLLPRLAADTVTLLHGDLDLSNAIPTDAGMALVDWEKASIGPVSLDLGFLIEFIRRREEIESYRLAFCDASGRGLAPERLGELIDLADGYDSLRWICHYLREVAAGRDPGPDWHDAYYVPRLDRLHSLRGRQQEWFLSSH